MKRRSEFKHWFVQQYGRMPVNSAKYQELRRNVQLAHDAFMRAQARLEVEDAMNAAFQAALYGWNARSPQ